MKLFSSSGLFLYGIGFSLPLVTIANRSQQVHSNSLPNEQLDSQASQNHAQPEMESHVSGSNTQNGTDSMINNDVDDPVKCILTNGTNCENSHSIQKRSYREWKFRDSFYERVNKQISSYSKLLDFRDFERSACMLNKFDSDRNKKIGYNLLTDIQFDELEVSIAKFLIDMFGDAKSCKYCHTAVLQEYYYEFKKLMDRMKNDIKDRFVQSSSMRDLEPYEADLKRGEFVYMQYYVYYDIVDFGLDKPSPFECIMMPTLPGCNPSHNIPKRINLAYYVFYSEIKLRDTSIDKNEIQQLRYKFNGDAMRKFFEYQFIKDMIRAMPVDYHQKYPRNVINGEKHILSVVNDIEYPTSHGICSKVVRTFENCYKYGQKRHFIFLIDGSGSVSDSDFNNMKKSIESMVNYPLNGHNSLSIIDFGSSPQQLCYDEYSAERIKSCIYSKNKSGGSTDINGALDYAVQNFINAESNPMINHVVVIFTDGEPDDTVRYKVAELRRMPRVTVTGFGIGDAFESYSTLQELKYITGDNRANLDEQKYRIRNFVEFEKNRLDLQNTICSA